MKSVVISLGGSIVAPGTINVSFLKEFRKLILKIVQKNKVIIICGGGKTARDYMSAARKVVKVTDDDLDWFGIHATRLNAHLLRTIFRNIAHESVVKNPNLKIDFKEKVLVAAGWKPGWSTDYIAIKLAQKFNIKTVINITNIDYVYDKDPSKFKTAKPMKERSWKKFRKLVGSKWNPGLNAPFDPVASKEAQKSRIKVVVLGKNLKNVASYLSGKEFKGTVIK